MRKVRCWRWFFGNEIPISLGVPLIGLVGVLSEDATRPIAIDSTVDSKAALGSQSRPLVQDGQKGLGFRNFTRRP